MKEVESVTDQEMRSSRNYQLINTPQNCERNRSGNAL